MTEARGHYFTIRSKVFMLTRVGIRRVGTTGIFGSAGLIKGSPGLKILDSLLRPYLIFIITTKLHILLTEV